MPRWKSKPKAPPLPDTIVTTKDIAQALRSAGMKPAVTKQSSIHGYQVVADGFAVCRGVGFDAPYYIQRITADDAPIDTVFYNSVQCALRDSNLPWRVFQLLRDRSLVIEVDFFKN